MTCPVLFRVDILISYYDMSCSGIHAVTYPQSSTCTRKLLPKFVDRLPITGSAEREPLHGNILYEWKQLQHIETASCYQFIT